MRMRLALAAAALAAAASVVSAQSFVGRSFTASTYGESGFIPPGPWAPSASTTTSS